MRDPAENDVRTQNRVQPTASDSSDLLFFIRKLRCEGTHFGAKFSKAPLRGGRRYTPCTSAQDRAACGEKMGSNPHFGAILNLYLALGKRRMFPRTQHWPLSKTPFVLWCLPLAPYRQARKTLDRKQLDSGDWGCRMTRLFSHETGRLDAPLKPRNLQRTARQASLVERGPPSPRPRARAPGLG